MRDDPGDERIVLLLNLAEPLNGSCAIAGPPGPRKSLPRYRRDRSRRHPCPGRIRRRGGLDPPRGVLQPLFLSQSPARLPVSIRVHPHGFSACERAAVLHMLRSLRQPAEPRHLRQRVRLHGLSAGIMGTLRAGGACLPAMAGPRRWHASRRLASPLPPL